MKRVFKANEKSVRCGCIDTAEPLNLVAVAGCSEDLAAVHALPDDWVPKHSGHVLQNYLKDREKKHDDILSNMLIDTCKFNADIDSKIRTLAEILSSHIKSNQKDIECVVGEQDICGNEPLSGEDRNAALKCISSLFKQRLDDLAKFKREASGIERERADGLRELLRNSFQMLISNGHYPPRELLHDFDERIYEINQQLLSNSRAYNELEAQLRLQADESLIRAKSVINQFCLGVALGDRRHSATPWSKQFDISEKRPSTSSAASTSKRKSSDPSIGNILSDAEEIEECVARLVEVYKHAVLKVFTGFSGKLTDLRQGLNTFIEPQLFEVKDLEQMIERAVRRVSTSVHQKIPRSKLALEHTLQDVVSMQKSLVSLGKTLHNLFSILHDAGHLFDSHIMRSALAQKLTITAVEDLLTNHDSVELANEMTFNIALEQLLNCSEPDKLLQQYEMIMDTLDRTAELYLKHSETEILKLEDFIKFLPAMIKITMSEFDCFLNKHPRDLANRSISIDNPMGSITPRKISNNTFFPLPRAILQTEIERDALLNWKNGFLESFESNMPVIAEELNRHAQQWVEERATALHARYSMKLMSHSVRAERVKTAHDQRLSEIRYHELRLESHLNAINNLITNLTLEASGYLNIESNNLYPLCDWIKRIKSNIDELLAMDPLDMERINLKMSSYACRISKHRSLFQESLEEEIKKIKNEIETRIQAARISNVRMYSHIKLLSEGGQYSAGEANKASAALIKAGEILESSVSKILETVNQRRVELLRQADEVILPVQKSIDEFAKPSGKGVKEKKSIAVVPKAPKKK